MTQKTVAVCDRCGEQATVQAPGQPHPDWGMAHLAKGLQRSSLAPSAIGGMGGSLSTAYQPVDLCGSCKRAFHAWWELGVTERPSIKKPEASF